MARPLKSSRPMHAWQTLKHLQTLVGPHVHISSEQVSMMARVQSDDDFAAVMRRAGIFFCRGGFTAFDQGLAGFMRVASRSRADALKQMVHDDQFLWIGVCAGAKIVGRDYLDMLNGVDVRYDAGVAPPLCPCLTDDRQLQLTSGVGVALDICGRWRDVRDDRTLRGVAFHTTKIGKSGASS